MKKIEKNGTAAPFDFYSKEDIYLISDIFYMMTYTFKKKNNRNKQASKYPEGIILKIIFHLPSCSRCFL